jgi:hypothetical protein
LQETISGVSQTALVSSLPDDKTGANVTLTATVTGDPTYLGTPTGTVDFYEGSQLIDIGGLDSSGQASVSVAAELFEPGKGSVTAVYLGDSNFDGSTSAAADESVTLPTEVGLIPSTNLVDTGGEVTFTANVSGYPGSWPGINPTGSVKIYLGKAIIGSAPLDVNGSASISVDDGALPPGVDDFTAKYSGDTVYDSSVTARGTYVQVMGATSTALATGENPASYGDVVTLTATVSPVFAGGATPTGTVTYYNGPTEIGAEPLDSSGVASFQLATALYGSGTMDITAAYGGDINYDVSGSSVLDEVVLAPSVVTLTASPNPATPGESVSLQVVVAGNPPTTATPTGTVTLYDGSTSLGPVTLSNGQATLSTSTLPTGMDFLSAVYGGDAAFTGSTGTAIEPVGYTATVLLTTSSSPVSAGTPVMFTATVTGSDGIPTGTVVFYPPSGLGPLPTPYGQATLDSTGVGSITLSVTATEGIYALYSPAPGSPYLPAQSNTLKEIVNGPRLPAGASARSWLVAASRRETLRGV